MKKYIKIILLILFIPLINVNALDDLDLYPTEENKQIGEPYINPKWIEWNNLSDEEKSNISVIPPKIITDYVYKQTDKYSLFNTKYKTIDVSIPSEYNLKDHDYMTPIKNQGSTGLCWDFATIGAIESNIKRTLGKEVIFSEKQVDYATTVGENSIIEKYNPYDPYRDVLKTEGGDFEFFNPLFMGGVVPQENDVWQYSLTDSKKHSLYDVFDQSHISYYVTDTVDFPMLDTSTASDDEIESYVTMIKEYILKYGGVYVATVTPDSRGGTCYNSKYKIIYQTPDCEVKDEDDGSHSMLIIGWDDNYDYGEETKGAWILKNSWGSTDHPYPYLAYKSDGSTLYGVKSTEEKNWNYVYDKYTDLTTVKKNSNTNYEIKFFRDGTVDEQIKKILIYTKYSDVNFDVYLVNKEKKQFIKTVNVENAGIYSIPIEDISLEGDDFSILINSSRSVNNPEVSIFTERNIDSLDKKIKSYTQSKYLDLNIVNGNKKVFKIGSITQNIDTGETIEYKFYRDDEDVTNNFTVENNYVVNNNVLADVTFDPNIITNDEYTVKSYYNDELLDEYTFNITGTLVKSLSSSIKDKISMKVNANKTIDVTVFPASAVNRDLKWEVLDDNVATFSNPVTKTVENMSTYYNSFKTLHGGDTKIRISTMDGSDVVLELDLSVNPLTEDVSITESNIFLGINDTKRVNYTISPPNANPNIFWQSDRPEIAEVNQSGDITGRSEGTTTIRATTKDGSNITKEISVTVSDFDIKSEKYLLDDTYTINKIKDNLLYNDFINDFTLNNNITVKIFNKETEKDKTKTIGTSDVLKTYKNNELKHEYKLIVSGDLDGDGKILATDILYLRRHILNQSVLNDIYFKAADIDENNSVNAIDILYMRRYILKQSDNIWGN